MKHYNAGEELDQALKGIAALTITATPPDIISIREELLRAMVAANVIASDREEEQSNLNDKFQDNQKLRAERDNIQGALAGVIRVVGLIKLNAESTLQSYFESIIQPGYNETAQTRLLAGRLREIGASAKEIEYAYYVGTLGRDYAATYGVQDRKSKPAQEKP